MSPCGNRNICNPLHFGFGLESVSTNVVRARCSIGENAAAKVNLRDIRLGTCSARQHGGRGPFVVRRAGLAGMH